MKSLNNLQRFGLLVLLMGPLVGLSGTIWHIYGSFDALGRAESAGIGAAGDSIQTALIFTALGLLGAILGISLFVFGKIIRDKRN